MKILLKDSQPNLIRDTICQETHLLKLTVSSSLRQQKVALTADSKNIIHAR